MVSYSALKAVCAAGDDVERQRKALKKLFGSFVKCDKNVVRTQVTSLVSMSVNVRLGGVVDVYGDFCHPLPSVPLPSFLAYRPFCSGKYSRRMNGQRLCNVSL